MVVSSGRYLRPRLRDSVYHHHSVVCSRGSSAEWWRGAAQVSRWKYDGVVGYPWSLRPNGLSLRTCRVIALPRVERGQQKRDAGSHRIRGVVHCLRRGSYLVKLCLVHHSQRELRRSHERRPAGGLRRGCKLSVCSASIPPGGCLQHNGPLLRDSHDRSRHAKGNLQEEYGLFGLGHGHPWDRFGSGPFFCKYFECNHNHHFRSHHSLGLVCRLQTLQARSAVIPMLLSITKRPLSTRGGSILACREQQVDMS